MRKNIIICFFMSCIVSTIFLGCSNTDENLSENTDNKTDVLEIPENPQKNNNVASKEEMGEIKSIDGKNLSPIYGNSIKNGTYKIKVDSSSSMFNVSECTLNVNAGKMTADMTMGGKGYLYVFMGKGEDAVNEKDFIPFKENADGEHIFTVPVKALDMPLECSSFSKNKNKWYDRTLLFRSDSVPAEAFNDLKTAETLNLKDGEYTAEVILEGGSGKASIQSPAKLKIENKQIYAEIIWSSSNYDYMIVNGQRFDEANTEGNSAFIIPVAGFDRKISVSADTTAMSMPHEIEYTLFFDSGTIQ